MLSILPKIIAITGAALSLATPVTLTYRPSQARIEFGEEPGSCSKLHLELQNAGAEIPRTDCAEDQSCGCEDADFVSCEFAGHNYWGYICRCIGRPTGPNVEETFSEAGR